MTRPELRERLLRNTALITEELNVKQLEFAANEAEAICTMIDVFTPKIPLRSASGTPRESVA